MLRLYTDLGIAFLAELEAAAKADCIKKAKGLGAALQTKILQNLAIARARPSPPGGPPTLSRTPRIRSQGPTVLKRVTVAGDFRRGCGLVGDLMIVAEAPKAAKTSKATVADGLQIRLTDRRHFGAALLFATGSAAHVAQLQTFAAEKNMRLGPTAFTGRPLIAGDETEI